MLKVKATIQTRTGEFITREFPVEFWHYATSQLFHRHKDIPAYLNVYSITLFYADDGSLEEQIEPQVLKRYEYDHLFLREAELQPRLSALGKEGWRVIKIFTLPELWYDIFLEREVC